MMSSSFQVRYAKKVYFLLLSFIIIFTLTDGFVPKQKPPTILNQVDRIFNPFPSTTPGITSIAKSGSKVESRLESKLDASRSETSKSDSKIESRSKQKGTENKPVGSEKPTSMDAVEGPTTTNPLLWRGVVLGICLVWSTNFAVIKEIFQAAPTIDPSLYAAIRFSLASLVMLPR
jgi:hypothetical protein